MVRNYNGWSEKIQQPTGFFIKKKKNNKHLILDTSESQ